MGSVRPTRSESASRIAEQDHDDPNAATRNIDDVVVRDNILFGGRATTMASVDDTDEQPSAWDMTAWLDHRAHHRPSSATPRWVLGWSDWPTAILPGPTLAQAQQRTGQEPRGLAFDDVDELFFVDHARLN